MPAFHISAYREKKPARSSGDTAVDSLSLPSSLLDLPFEARIRTGSGRGGCRSAKGEDCGSGFVVDVLDRSDGVTALLK